MSAAQAKRTRRDIRRAVGEEALGVVDNHGEALKTHGKRIEALANALARQGAGVDAAFVAAGDALQDRTEPLRRGFWGRMRWVLLGR